MTKKTHFGYQQVDEAEKSTKVAEVFHSVAKKYDLMVYTVYGRNSPYLPPELKKTIRY